MKTSMAKYRFLRLAYQMQVGGSTDCGRLEVVETNVHHLHEELEASQSNELLYHEV
jgi:hypothetical protein